MTRKQKPLMRLALAIHEQLKTNESAAEHVALPEATWRHAEVLFRRMRRARQQGWRLAAKRLQRELRQTLCWLRDELTAIDGQLEPAHDESCRASAADIYADLVALHEEFDAVSFDLLGKTIAVTTEPIELDGVYLGPFEIRLAWGDLMDGHPRNYRVIAVEANPAASNEGVTHPHVQDEAVCEGEGKLPIRNSLEQGRLLDFFMIVANLLRTYNSDSPFVSLSEWHGVPCADCGTTVADDEQWSCQRCGTTVCGECYYNCSDCSGTFCSACVTACAGCDESHCDECLKQCSRCHAEHCRACLKRQERCSSCHDRETEEEREASRGVGEFDGDRAAIATLQPDRLGETAVPA